MRNGATVSAADIARLADVGRAAVSNWRKRYDDFPRPVGGTATSPAFSLEEVEAWLRRQGKKFTVSTGDRIWQRLRATDDELRLGDLVGGVGVFLLFHARDRAAWQKLAASGEMLAHLPDAVAAAVPDVPGPPVLPGDPDLLHALAAFAAEDGEASAFDFLCARYTEAHSRRLLATPDAIARLMTGLAGGRAVLDPACGIGTLLLASAADRVLGQEVNPTAARLTAVRLLLHGRRATIASGDSLRADAFTGEHLDAVVCNPPFGDRTWGYEELSSDPRWEYGLPPRGEPELAWAQHCLAHVRPGGHVAIMMPSTAAGRRSGRCIRGTLLRSGALRAVVSLPAGAAPASSMAPDLWLLRRPVPREHPPSRVLMVDATGDLSLALAAWEAFRDNPDGDLRSVRGAVPRIIDLLDDEVDVSTARHLAPTSEVSAEGFRGIRERLAVAARALDGTVPDLAGVPAPRDLSWTSVGDLVKAGVVTVCQAPLRMPLDGGDLPVLTLDDVATGAAPSGRTRADAGAVICAPGDVVVPVPATSPIARVITEPGVALGPQLYLLRPDPDRLDPHFLAGFLRMAGMSGLARASSASSRIDPRRARVPLLPPAEQRPYGAAFRRLTEVENAARDVARLSASLVRLGFDGLGDGTLRPG